MNGINRQIIDFLASMYSDEYIMLPIITLAFHGAASFLGQWQTKGEIDAAKQDRTRPERL